MLTIYWDGRNGLDTHPYPHGQDCPQCGMLLRAIDVDCDYYPSKKRCECGATIELPGVRDKARFSGLLRDTVIEPGEIPVNCSDLVREQFESLERKYT
jgi:hypothetical protein